MFKVTNELISNPKKVCYAVTVEFMYGDGDVYDTFVEQCNSSYKMESVYKLWKTAKGLNDKNNLYYESLEELGFSEESIEYLFNNIGYADSIINVTASFFDQNGNEWKVEIYV
jgi:hypothetical protein